MPEAANVEELFRYLILAIPALVLIVLFMMLFKARGAKQQEAAKDPRAYSYLDARSPHETGSASSAQAEAFAASAPGAATSVQEQPAVTIAHLEERLTGAEEAGEPAALTMIYLALGRARLSAGQERAGLEALRSAAGLAALHKLARMHAEARLELAENAFNAGDLTTACEHWQMARMAFLDDGARAEGDKIDRRMRANGCPTDWVLTDF